MGRSLRGLDLFVHQLLESLGITFRVHLVVLLSEHTAQSLDRLEVRVDVLVVRVKISLLRVGVGLLVKVLLSNVVSNEVDGAVARVRRCEMARRDERTDLGPVMENSTTSTSSTRVMLTETCSVCRKSNLIRNVLGVGEEVQRRYARHRVGGGR